MDSKSENLTFSLKNGEKLSRKHMRSSPSSQEQNMQKITILGFISDLIRGWPAMAAPSCYSVPALAACPERMSDFKSFKPPFHNTPSSHDTKKLPVHAKINFESSTCPSRCSWETKVVCEILYVTITSTKSHHDGRLPCLAALYLFMHYHYFDLYDLVDYLLAHLVDVLDHYYHYPRIFPAEVI
uniref:'chromo' domain containing protein n=1 Tax=Solanum tuberosum TaxID=4113 RepID=M1DRR7_SOLTU